MQQLTSDNTPVRVDFLPITATRLPGRIGMTIAPGKRTPGIYGNWHRDLEKDLTRIKTVHGASVLVCLLEIGLEPSRWRASLLSRRTDILSAICPPATWRQ